VLSDEVAAPDFMRVFDLVGEGAADRGAAFLIDLVVVGGVAYGSCALLSACVDQSARPQVLLVAAVWAVLHIAYSTFAEGRFGTTLGKLALWPLSLRVVRAGGGRIGYREAATRALVSPLDLGAVFSLVGWRGSRRRFGDLAAGTMVVDRGKLREVTDTPEGLRFERLDGTCETLAELHDAFVSTWAGSPQYLVLRGVSPAGAPVHLRFRFTRGVTVLGIDPRMQELRGWLEWHYERRFPEKMEPWRYAMVAAALAAPLLGVLIVAAGCAWVR
jgi:uncharacterized RDD family membrane protein YckC